MKNLRTHPLNLKRVIPAKGYKETPRVLVNTKTLFCCRFDNGILIENQNQDPLVYDTTNKHRKCIRPVQYLNIILIKIPNSKEEHKNLILENNLFIN